MRDFSEEKREASISVYEVVTTSRSSCVVALSIRRCAADPQRGSCLLSQEVPVRIVLHGDLCRTLCYSQFLKLKTNAARLKWTDNKSSLRVQHTRYHSSTG